MKVFLSTLFVLAVCTVSVLAQGATFRPGDTFQLQLSGMPLEYSQEFALQLTIGDDGTISLPHIGVVRAAGQSSQQLARAIEQKLVSEKIFTGPVAVINVQPQSRFVTIGGAVRAPQALPWSPDMTLSNALKRVGGIGDFGSDKKIRVTRDGKTQVFNLRLAGKDPNQNPKLLPGDEVEVPE